MPDAASRSVQLRRLPFRTHDFGGRLAERGDTGLPQLTAQFHDWLEKADCLLFFLAVDQLQDPAQAQDRLLEVDALLSRLIEKGPSGHAISQPIAVLITKWDLVSDLSGSPEEEDRKVRQFLEDLAGDLGTTVCGKIERAGEQVRVFPVSTFGGHVDGRPIHPLKPFNLHEPLVWALQQTDWVLFEKARRQAEEALAKPYAKVWIDYARAIQIYKSLVDEYGIDQGPVYAKVQAELALLGAKQRRRTGGLLGVGALMVLVAVVYGSFHLDRRTFIDLMAKLDAPRDPYPALEQQVSDYGKSHNPWAAVLGRKSQVAERWEQYKQRIEEGFADLEQLRKQPARPGLAEQAEHYRRLRNACQDFLAKYPESHYQAQVEAWRVATERDLRPMEFSLNVDSLVRQWSGGEKRDDRAKDLLDEAEKLKKQVPDPVDDSVVAEAVRRLDTLRGDLKTFLGDVEAKCQKYVAEVKDWLERSQKAIDAKPADLASLKNLEQQGKELQKKPVPDGSDAKATSDKLDAQLVRLAGEINRLNNEVSVWLSSAQEAKESADRALTPEMQETGPMEAARKQVDNVSEQAKNLPRSEKVSQMLGELRERQNRLKAEIDRYQKFDQAYQELVKKLNSQSPEEQRKTLRGFLNEYPHHDDPRREGKLKELQNRIEILGREIDKSRWGVVQKKFDELRQLAGKANEGGDFDLVAVRNAFDQFQQSAEHYKKGDDPAPQHVEEVNRLEQMACGLLDKAEWWDVEQLAKKNDKDFERIAHRAKDYLDGDDRLPTDKRKHRQDAEVMIRQTLADRWKELYGAFYERATNVDSVEKLKEARDKCDEAATWAQEKRAGEFTSFVPDQVPKQREKVTEWKRWADGLLGDRKLEVTIAFTEVKAAGLASDRQIKLHIWLDDDEWREENWGPANRNAAPWAIQFRARQFNKKNEVKVQLAVRGFWGWWNDHHDSDPLNVLDLFVKRAGEVTIRDPAAGKAATVKLSCPELTPPSLDAP